MTKKDYYDVLGVEKNCDEKTLKTAFRKLAKQHHPDHNSGNPDSESKFKEVSEAYERLKNAESRAAYDRYGHALLMDLEVEDLLVQDLMVIFHQLFLIYSTIFLEILALAQDQVGRLIEGLI